MALLNCGTVNAVGFGCCRICCKLNLSYNYTLAEGIVIWSFEM